MANSVFVACKLPNGLVCEFRGAIPEQFEKHAGKRVVLEGSKPSTVLHLPGVSPRYGGFGVTEVDADFMNAWMELHKDFPAVKNGLIFTAPSYDRARGLATDKGGLKSGLEPCDPKAPPPGIEIADETKKAA